MRKAKVPVVPGTKEPVYTVAQAQEAVKEIGFPVMIKASAGGGGKGMRVARNEKEFGKLFETAQQESIHSFSDNTMYLERFVENPRHVEVQILADKYGNAIHLGERDCSVQRRHQKMIEESRVLQFQINFERKWVRQPFLPQKPQAMKVPGQSNFFWTSPENSTSWK